jgi:hypothetical protein
VALLLGIEITRRSHIVMDRTLSWCIGITSLLVTGAFAIALIYESHLPLPSMPMNSEMAGVLACASVWVVYSCRQMIFKKRNETRDAAIFAIGLITTPLLAIVLQVEHARSPNNSSQDIATLIERRAPSGTKVFVYRNFEDVFASLPFYLGKKVKVIDSVSADLQFGCGMTQDTNSACMTLRDFKRDYVYSPVAVAVENDRLEEFYKAAGRNGWRDEAVGNKHVLFNF